MSSLKLLEPTGSLRVRLAGVVADMVVPLGDDGSIRERDHIVRIQRMARTPTIMGVLLGGRFSAAEGFTASERRTLSELTASAIPRGFPWLLGIDLDTSDDPRADVELAAQTGATAAVLYGGDADTWAASAVPAFPLIVVVGSHRELVERLSVVGHVVGVIIEGGDGSELRDMRDTLGPDAAVLVTETFDPSLIGPADGALSGSANVAPDWVGRFVAAALTGDRERMSATRPRIDSLISPAPMTPSEVKASLWLLGVLDTPVSRYRDPVASGDLDVLRSRLTDAGLVPIA